MKKNYCSVCIFNIRYKYIFCVWFLLFIHFNKNTTLVATFIQFLKTLKNKFYVLGIWVYDYFFFYFSIFQILHTKQNILFLHNHNYLLQTQYIFSNFFILFYYFAFLIQISIFTSICISHFFIKRICIKNVFNLFLICFWFLDLQKTAILFWCMILLSLLFKNVFYLKLCCRTFISDFVCVLFYAVCTKASFVTKATFMFFILFLTF